jgi:hypothetical protein
VKLIIFLKIQDGGIHWGVAVPQAGDTQWGQSTVPSKYKEVANLRTGRSTLSSRLRKLEQTLIELKVGEYISCANEAASTEDFNMKKR